MKSGDKKSFIYIPFLGFIEAAATMEETMERVHREEVKKEIEDKKRLRRLKREYPGHFI